MHHFATKRGEMVCEGVPLRRIANTVGTPVYVYSHATLSHHYRVFDRAFSGIPHIICYSMKANPNGSIIRTFTNLGSGVDIVSGGGLSRALAPGTPPPQIAYSRAVTRGRRGAGTSRSWAWTATSAPSSRRYPPSWTPPAGSGRWSTA